MLLLAGLSCLPAFASGARYVTGPPFFTGQAGVPVGWKGPALAYYTDPGDLSAYVTHAQADALVAAAAGVWNVPVAAITVSRGGALAEHVSGSNVYLGAQGMVYPDDVSSANAAARPIAVVYDTDGSVTDTLLGLGASAPASCRQNAVFETVDRFDPAGYILHAIIVLNGRCTASAPAAQLDMQYKLQRVFGRVLGLAWSQANDNVFTGTPVPTYTQAMYWPLMHPVEIICGTYTYTCMPSPFTLRTDDVASLVLVYPIRTAAAAAAAGAGKTVSLAAAGFAYGAVTFPTGEGMAGVNMLASRDGVGGAAESWVTASGVTGAMFRRNGTSAALVAADGSAWGSMGSFGADPMGDFSVSYVPFPGSQGYVNIHVTTEPVNPLYTGQYSIGPYAVGAVTPSGSPPGVRTTTGVTPGNSAPTFVQIADAAGSCGNSGDGTASQPVPVDPSGWWKGLLCGYGQVAWVHLPVQAGRTFTVEVTALDANGLATSAKLMPVMGLWGASDAAGSLPTQGVAATAFLGRGTGMSVLGGTTGTMTEMRLAVADQRGDGRPDYSFQGRFFYADSLLPAQVAASGGTVTVSGFGFKAGNAVYVNGVPGTVTQWTQRSLTVTVPTRAAAGATSGTAVDVKVVDLQTGAVSTMSGALTYALVAPVLKQMKLVSAEVADVVVGQAAAVPFAVRVFQADGVTPAAGEPVVFSFAAGTASYGACGGPRCVVLTDGSGLASTTVTPGAAGLVTMTAADGMLSETASFNALDRDAQMVVIEAPGGTQPVFQVAQPEFLIRVFGPGGYAPASGRTITWTVTAGSAVLGTCFAPVCTTVTEGNGATQMLITPLLPGTVTVTASDGLLVQAISFQAVLQLDTMTLTAVPTSPSATGTVAGTFGVRLVTPQGYGDNTQPVVFSAPSGVVFNQCGRTNPCTVWPDGQGNVTTAVIATAAGSYTLVATAGSGITLLQQTASLTATTQPIVRMRIVSMPSNNQLVGAYTDKPFAVQLLQADGVTPAGGSGVTLGGAPDTVALDCGKAACLTASDGNGVASVRVVPLHAGPISMSAAWVPFSVSGVFTAVSATKTMTVVSQPANGTYVGDSATLTVQVLGTDGVTPAAGETVVFSVAGGSFTFAGCSATCTAVTNAAGRASLSGTATAPGAVQLRAADGPVSQTAAFMAQNRADTMQVVQAPAAKVEAGGFLATPFQVRVLLPDGVTPAAGRTVLFAVSVGYAGFSACPAASCTVTTDSNGLAQTAVYTTAPGAVTLEAIDTSAGQTAYALASFTAVGVGDTLRVVSAPTDGTVIYDFNPAAFTVQVLGPDGSTPVPGHNVTISTTVGNTGTTLCNGAPGCTALSDAQGMVSTLVRPLSAGTVTMTATDGPLSRSVTFQVLRQPDSLSLVSGPADGSFAGGPAAAPFAVKVVQPDGMVGAGRNVTLTVVSGAATLGACGAASCTVTANASGVASSTVTPTAAGTVALRATDGTVQLGYSFGAVARADTLTVVSAPADGGQAGTAAAPAFSVRVSGGYAGTAVAGRTVVFRVAAGSAALGCGAATCSVVTDANGLAAISATPNVAGTVALEAADGAVSVQVSFQVAAAAHGLRLRSAPTDGSYVGVAASPAFAVQVVLADGTTPVAGDTVLVRVQNGTVCGGAASCSAVSDAGGMVQMAVTPAAAGTVTLSAVDGAATLSASFAAQARPDALSVVSAPSGTGTVGVAMAAPFSVKLVAGDGSARAGVAVVFSVAAGSASFAACPGAASCSLVTDANGLASTSVTPSAAGSISVQAVAEGMTVAASFAAQAPPAPPAPPAPDVLSVVSVPSGTGTVGVAMASPFSVKLLAGDGSARAGVAVVFSVAAGSASFAACPGAASCSLVTDANGLASTSVTPSAAGLITVQAVAEGMTVTASFAAQAPPAPPAPDVLSVVSAPSGTGTVGVAMAAPFSVKLVAGDGSARAGVAVVFSVAAGSASFAACPGAASCSLVTDANGIASTSVTPSAAGSITVQAVAEGMTVSASFAAQAPPAPPAPDVLSVVSAPSGTGTVGVAMAAPFSVKLVAGDGSARAGVAVVFSVAAGSASFGACPGAASCSLVTDAKGLVATEVTAAAAGAVTMQAVSEGMTVQASFLAKDPPPDVLSVVTAPAGTGTVGVSMPAAFAVQVLAGDGSPRSGIPVAFSVVTGAASFGACAGSSVCTVLTDGHGLALTAVTPAAPDGVTVQASAERMTVSASFSAIPAPDRIAVAQAPPAQVYVGDTTGFAVQVLLADGQTPAAGILVTFSGVGAGQAGFDACGGATVCAVSTDAHGVAAAGVTGMQPGAVTLMASADAASRAGAVSASLNVLADVYGLTFTGGPAGAGATRYVAEGAAFRDGLQVLLTRNGAPAAGVSVGWTATAGAGVAGSTSVTDVGGAAGMSVVLGPLAAGATGTIQACAWAGTCAQFLAVGVADDALRIEVAAGATQTVAAGQSPAALVGQVTDAAGHPVAGAAVTVFETMYATVTCPPRGRCPAAAVLGTRATVLVSGEDGTVSLTPMSGAGTGTPSETKLELTVGTAGVASGDVVSGG